MSNIKIIAICGSLRKNSITKKALEIALKGALNIGAKTEFIDLRDYKLPFCKEYEDDMISKDVIKLKTKVKNANGIILGTPDYHGSFSGVIKNAIDLMGFEEFEGKMIGLIGVAGGSQGSVNALNGLRNIGRQLHSWVIPQQAMITRSSQAFDDENKLKDLKLEKRIIEIGEQVTKFASLHHDQKNQEFLKQWEEAPANPGGD